jgi:adenylylsulfate kinase-like enzyme
MCTDTINEVQLLDCLTISLNGPDNVGITTLMGYMPIEGVDLRSDVHKYDDLMNDLVNKGTLKEWWFTNSNHEEFINVIMRAVNKRANVSPKKNTKFIIYDRGGLMFEAVCIATIACKEKCDLTQAEVIYNSIIEKCKIQIPCENICILLKHGHSLKISLMREHEHDQLYEDYQKLLQSQLQIQELKNKYTHVINVTEMSVIQIQNEIRAIIRKYCLSTSAKTIRHFNPMFEYVNVIIAFGGMSESGKSTLAEGTCRKLESVGVKCIRLKIAYFMELASDALGTDVYKLPEEKQANELVKQLDHYLRRHYWVAAITIESLHRLVSTQFLKLILGNLIQVVYVDTSMDTRIQRSCVDTEALRYEDLVKMSRGADKIRLEATTFVLDNDNFTFEESINSIYEMIRQKNEKIKLQQLMHKRYTGKINLFSNQFVLSAGSVLIKKSTLEVCLIHQLEGRGEWVLPKGRKNDNETLSASAVRETFEETG